MSDFAAPSTVPDEPVPDYLIWGILLTIFGTLCCFLFLSIPFGVASLIFTNRANTSKARNDLESAFREASRAKRMLVFGAIAGVVSVLLTVGFVGFGIAAGWGDDESSGYSSYDY